MLLASKTLASIEAALVADQGATFRKYLGELMPLAGDAYNPTHDDWRNHLGASLIGRQCARELWYSFHWTTLKRFEGRMLRLFNRGHLEEPRFIALLKMIGCEVWQITHEGKQFRILGHKGHYGGSLDGVANNIPDLPGIPVLTEFKTHGEKSFIKLTQEGVLKTKWEHFVQMQQYMGYYSLDWGLYCAVNKNTDAIHMELVQFDPTQFQKYRDRSAMVIDASSPPPRINESPGWFECKFCDQKAVCHGKAAPARNCRTCLHSTPVDNGQWVCNLMEPVVISPEKQRVGCDDYVVNPAYQK